MFGYEPIFREAEQRFLLLILKKKKKIRPLMSAGISSDNWVYN
jgi:hypothetical protein